MIDTDQRASMLMGYIEFGHTLTVRCVLRDRVELDVRTLRRLICMGQIKVVHDGILTLKVAAGRS